MKIAINGRLLVGRNLEGIGRFSHEVIKRMVNDHPKDEFYIFFDRDIDGLFRYGSNVQCHKIGLPARHPLLWRFWFDYFLSNELKRIRPDVFFSPETFMPLRCSVPSVITTHDLAYEYYPQFSKWSHAKFYRKYSRKYHDSADKVIAVSNFTKDSIVEKYGTDKSKIDVVYNATDKSFFPLSLAEKEAFKDQFGFQGPYLLYLGSIHPRKNIVRLIEAYEFYRKDHPRSKLKLVLAGRMAWKYDRVEAAIKVSDYRMDIIHLGFFNGDLNQLINGAEAMIYPSLFEGFGIPVLEALSAGVPTLCSNNSSMPEIAGDASVYFNPMNSRDMAVAIDKVIGDQVLRETMIVAGTKQASLFSWQRSSEQIYNILTRVANT